MSLPLLLGLSLPLGLCLSQGGRGGGLQQGNPLGTCVSLPTALQGEFRVAERTITMKQLLRALEEGRVREVFGPGTACQVCPVHRILYKDKVRRGCHCG